MVKKFICSALVLTAVTASAKELYDANLFLKVPKTFPVTEKFDFKVPENVKAVWLEGLPWKGKPTRLFAWYGIPSGVKGKIPGIILLHGSGGTAFSEWVRRWTERGYAAIAIDTCGGIPGYPFEGMVVKGGKSRSPHAFSGPQEKGWSNTDLPIEDQWNYHALSAAILANSFLRSLPEVDPDKIGIVGISMGCKISQQAAGIDKRLQFAVQVYGCAFLNECVYRKINPDYFRLWDPSLFLKDAKIPLFYVKGANDFAFFNHPWQRTTTLPEGDVYTRLTPFMWHGHAPADIPEIKIFADQCVMGGTPLPKAVKSGRDGNMVWTEFDGKVKLVSALLAYSEMAGDNPKKPWKTLPASIRNHRVEADLPSSAKEYFLTVKEERGMTVSSPFEEAVKPE